MKSNVYSIRDNKIGSFQRPVLGQTDGEMIRQFGDLVSSGGDNIIVKHPEDFTLYRLGSYDDASGKFDNLDCPVALVTGSDFAVAKE